MAEVKIGHHFRQRPARTEDGQRVDRWEVLYSEQFLRDASAIVAKAYVARRAAVSNPTLKLDHSLPTAPNVRLGDFGELVARSLLFERYGREVPLQKMRLRATANATIQGPDVLAATLISSLHDPRAEIWEVKARSSRITAGRLCTKELIREVSAVTDLDSSWAMALQTLSDLPDADSIRAKHIARHFAHESADSELEPPRRNVMSICSDDGVDASDFWARWPADWGDSRLVIVEMPDLATLVERVFSQAGCFTWGQVVDLESDPHFPSGLEHLVPSNR